MEELYTQFIRKIKCHNINKIDQSIIDLIDPYKESKFSHIEEEQLNKVENKQITKYTEYSLSSLYITDGNIPIEKDTQYETFLNVITKASDVNNTYTWVDSYFKIQKQEELNILVPKGENKELIFREYIKPNNLKNVCIVKKFEQAGIVKSPENNKVNVQFVTEFSTNKDFLCALQTTGYHLSHKIYVEARIFHSKYGNSDHVIILVLRHYKDEQCKQPLSPDRALVQIKSYSNINKYSEITQKNLLQYAEIFKPFVSLRKVDNYLVEKAAYNNT